ncbi:MAG: hypothetical protein DIU78_013780 [Pseudomonadota bacterium]
MGTQNNELSFWSCGCADESELREAVLALAANGDRLDKMDLVWLARVDVEKAAVAINPSPDHANTPVEAEKKRHVDFTRLDLERLSRIARLMRDAIASDNWKRFGKNDVLNVLVKAVREGRLKTEQLKDGLRKKVEAAMLEAEPPGGS